MDINLIRTTITIAAMGAFLLIVLWAYWPARRERLDEQARSILEDADEGSHAGSRA